MVDRSQTKHIDLQHFIKALPTSNIIKLSHENQETLNVSANEIPASLKKQDFLTLLLKLMGAKRTIEVGIFRGYGGLQTPTALPSYGQVIACDVGSGWAHIDKYARNTRSAPNKIDLRLGSAKELLLLLLEKGEDDQFDFALIDADKQNYPSYYQYCIQLVRPGGLIVIDHVLWDSDLQGEFNFSPDTIAARAINRMVKADARVEACEVSFETGLLLIRKLAK